MAAFPSAMQRWFCSGVVDFRAACARSTDLVLPHWANFVEKLLLI